MYNIFNNIISNTVSIDSHIRSIVREETIDIVSKVNTALETHSRIKVDNLGDFSGTYTNIGRVSIQNSRFIPSQKSIYVLSKGGDVFYTITFIDPIGWSFVEFSTNPEPLLSLTLDLTEFIESTSFITSETKYFGTSNYPKNLNIAYI